MIQERKITTRLVALNRGPLRERRGGKSGAEEIRREIKKRHATGSPQPLQPILYCRGAPFPDPKLPRPRALHGKPVALEEVVKGIITDSLHGATAYVISNHILTREGEPSPLNAAFRDALVRKDSALCAWLSDVCSVEALLPEDVALFDLETTGLASTPIFLVGAMSWEGDGLVVRQYLARNYSEEPAILSLFLDWAATKALLVSFNGKSFDLPYARVRAAANGIPFSLDLPHFDLLHVARRVWKDTLSNHRFQTLETHICGRVRSSDIPSCDIPDAYHAYVRTANAAELVEILEHNLLDLVTLADLMVRLPPPD